MRPGTICWGLAAWCGVLFAQSPPAPAPTGNDVPAPQAPSSIAAPAVPPPGAVPGAPAPPAAPASAYPHLWNSVIGPAVRARLTAGTANFFLALDDKPVVVRSIATGAESGWTTSLVPDVDMWAGDGLLLVATATGLHLLEESTGVERWQVASGPLQVAPMSQGGWVLAAAKDGSIIARRLTDGSEVWRAALGAPASAGLAVDGNRLFVPLSDHRLVALAIDAGKVEWTFQLDGVGSEPLAVGGRVYVGTSAGHFYALKQGASDRPAFVHSRINEPVVGRPVIDDRYVYCATLLNRVVALDRLTGSIDWYRNLPTRPGRQVLIDATRLVVPLVSGDVNILSTLEGGRSVSPPLAAPKPVEGTALRILVRGGPPGSPHLLRLTLGNDANLTLSAFGPATAAK